ncbi:MAG: sugar phosphate isomerase/epimerase [Armatimonadetes bacterium]|nr:sugar phosphate isomerase/epimerase [Armatimonadota bacterium]
MFTCLSPGAIGIGADLAKAIDLAKATGFEGVELSIGEIANLIEQESAEAVKARFEESGIRPGGWGLPLDWRAPEEAFQEQIKSLPRFANAGQSIGCTRTCTWILPFSDDTPLEENIEWHVKRFGAIARVLKDYGCSIGLEFIGPKTLRAGHQYEFIYTMKGMLDLGDRIGTGNVGLLLDCWHWYTSGGTLEALGRVRPERVVYVHVNDAPAGVPVDEQIDNIRCLPGETGVIDLVGFLRLLKAIGYDGPITPEPFSKKLSGLAPIEAARMTAEALQDVWRKAGLAG